MAKTHYNRSVSSDKIVVDANLKAGATLVIPVHAGGPDLSPGIDEDGHIGIQNAGTDPALFFKAGGNIYPLANAGGLEQTANKNTANGYAGLDGSGKVAAAQLPSYVDDVLEVADYAALPATGESGNIYVTVDDNKEYRWSGSTYIQLVPSPGSTDALTEGATNKYFTAARVLATALTGLDLSSHADVIAADTVLQAIGKLQAHISAEEADRIAEITSLSLKFNQFSFNLYQSII